MTISKIAISLSLLLAITTQAFADTQPQDTTPTESTSLSKSEIRTYRRDSIRANKKVWRSILGGPSYTPEASAGVAAAVLMSFRMNESDTISQRSFLPMGVNASINGTVVVAGNGTLFFNENQFRIYTNYGVRNEPTNFYGVGFSEIDATPRGDETTLFDKTNVYFNTKSVWEVCPYLYMGAITDINFSSSRNLNPVMAANAYVNKYSLRYTNIGVGGIVQYDSRDDVATPNSGLLLSATGKVFSRAIGGSYNYQLVDLEYRQFQPLFQRAILAWVARTQISYGDVPFTELPMFGSPFDLRGYYWGQYRDKSMGYGIVEFRHMLGSKEDYQRGRAISKFGYVAWVGAGTLGTTPKDWDEWKLNYGFGLRAQLQPRKNVRIDFGKGVGGGWLTYFNMTEAF
ncbi:MAG: BamA/TamA family outer membrane protein [Rikenellaceae bacterium]